MRPKFISGLPQPSSTPLSLPEPFDARDSGAVGLPDRALAPNCTTASRSYGDALRNRSDWFRYMQTLTATKDNDPPDSGSPRNWRRRKQENARRRQLVAAYVSALGGSASVTPIQMQDIERAVDLVLLARTARAELSAGKTTINAVVKLENAADRAVRRLNLPASGAAAPVQTLQDYLARRAERAEEHAGASKGGE